MATLVNLFVENESNIPYYNPKFGYLAFEDEKGDACFFKIKSCENINNNFILDIKDVCLSAETPTPEYLEMLTDSDWNFSENIKLKDKWRTLDEDDDSYEFNIYSDKMKENYLYLGKLISKFDAYKNFFETSLFDE